MKKSNKKMATIIAIAMLITTVPVFAFATEFILNLEQATLSYDADIDCSWDEGGYLVYEAWDDYTHLVSCSYEGCHGLDVLQYHDFGGESNCANDIYCSGCGYMISESFLGDHDYVYTPDGYLNLHYISCANQEFSNCNGGCSYSAQRAHWWSDDYVYTTYRDGSTMKIRHKIGFECVDCYEFNELNDYQCSVNSMSCSGDCGPTINSVESEGEID